MTRVLPAELVAADRWVRRLGKRPITTRFRPASSTNSETWASYESVTASRAGDGYGFVLNGDGVVCMDLDHCLTDGVLAGWAEAILEDQPETYVEVSPSGSGLHVWGLGDLPKGRCFRDGVRSIEFYGVGRYMTVTEDPFRAATSVLSPLALPRV